MITMSTSDKNLREKSIFTQFPHKKKLKKTTYLLFKKIHHTLYTKNNTPLKNHSTIFIQKCNKNTNKKTAQIHKISKLKKTLNYKVTHIIKI